MARWKLCFSLLLPLTVCFDSEVTHVKTIGGELDVTPICTNSTLDIVTLVVCKISTERSGGEECRLLYQYGQDFVCECDSRFTLITENQTVFLHLTSLTPVDSGSYTCECSQPSGTYIQHLNITVEAEEDAVSPPAISSPLIGVAVVVIITGVILGLIHRTKCNGHRRSATSGLSDLDDPDDAYISLKQAAGDLYQTISKPAGNKAPDHVDNQEIG